MSPGTVFAVALPFIVMAGAAALIWAAILMPFPSDRYDDATVVRICRDGSRIFRMEDGSFHTLRPSAFRGYRVENPDTVCG